MPRCADRTCGRWRPDLSWLERFTASLQTVGALQFNGQWYCSRACVEQAARVRLTGPRSGTAAAAALPRLRLGVLLRHAGAVTQPELDAALAAAERNGLRLGDQLERLGYTSADDVLRALAAQSGVSYFSTFDVARVVKVPVSLPATTVRALGLVPFDVDPTQRRLSVVCAGPLPKAAVRAVTRLTGWTPDVFLVSDRVFESALAAYTPATDAVASHEAVTVGGVRAAAARVADLAAHERAVTMRLAEWNEYRWVRVQGRERVSDLLVTETRKETACRAELTAH